MHIERQNSWNTTAVPISSCNKWIRLHECSIEIGFLVLSEKEIMRNRQRWVLKEKLCTYWPLTIHSLSCAIHRHESADWSTWTTGSSTHHISAGRTLRILKHSCLLAIQFSYVGSMPDTHVSASNSHYFCIGNFSFANKRRVLVCTETASSGNTLLRRCSLAQPSYFIVATGPLTARCVIVQSTFDSLTRLTMTRYQNRIIWQ